MMGVTAYPSAYLVLSAWALAAWGVLYVLAPNSRRAMISTSLVFAVAGPVAEYWDGRDYWHPGYVFEFTLGGWRFGIEDYLCAFAYAGIAAGVFEACARRRTGADSSPPDSRTLVRMGLLGLAGFLAMAAAMFIPGIRSIDAHIGTIALLSLLMIGRRAAVWRLQALLVPAAMLVYTLYLHVAFTLAYPGIVERVWIPSGRSGVDLLGIPVEESLWAGAVMLFCGPVYRLCAGRNPET